MKSDDKCPAHIMNDRIDHKVIIYDNSGVKLRMLKTSTVVCLYKKQVAYRIET